jgi:hypothetical protein
LFARRATAINGNIGFAVAVPIADDRRNIARPPELFLMERVV